MDKKIIKQSIFTPHLGNCPTCGYHFEIATPVHPFEKIPNFQVNIGDVSVCLNCGQLCEVGPGFGLIPVELTKVALHKDVSGRTIRMLSEAQSFIRKNKLCGNSATTQQRGTSYSRRAKIIAEMEQDMKRIPRKRS